MSFHRSVRPLVFNYKILDTQLQRCHTVRDLGVTLDRKLDFRNHYCDIIDKAYKMVGFIRRQSNELSEPSLADVTLHYTNFKLKLLPVR